MIDTLAEHCEQEHDFALIVDGVPELTQHVEDARAKRHADQQHRNKIRDDIATSIQGFAGEMESLLIANAIIDGAIPHVKAVL